MTTRFIKNVIGGDEKLLLLARLHWIYLVTGFFWLAALAGGGLWLDEMLWAYFGQYAPQSPINILGVAFGSLYRWIFWMMTGSGLMIFIIHVLKVIATEVALTDQRLIYKTGLFFVEVDELDLTEIKAERVHHGLLGRFLGYGEFHFDSRFVKDFYLPAVRKPYRLLKALHAARHKIHDALDK